MPSVKVSIAPSSYSITIGLTSARSATVTNNSDMQIIVQLEFTDEYSLVKKVFSGKRINPGHSATLEPNSDGLITGVYIIYPTGAAVNYIPVSSTSSGTSIYHISPPPMAEF